MPSSPILDRLLHLKNVVLSRHGLQSDFMGMAASDLTDGDRIVFAGQVFSVTRVRQYGTHVAVDAEYGTSHIDIEFLPFEEVTIALPRPASARHVGGR